MPTQKKQDKGTGAMVGGGALTAYGAANAPVLRAGSKDQSKMVGASPKLQGKRYQAKLHQAMKAGKVEADSTVHVLRTPSGRHINAGGTHRHIARQAMGKPSRYEVKDIKHEVHVSPAQKLQAGLRLRGLRQGSKAAEAGKNVRSVSPGRAGMNQGLAAAADVNDAALWKNPSALKSMAARGRKAGLVGAGTFAGGGLLLAGSGAKKRQEYKQHNVAKARKTDVAIAAGGAGLAFGGIAAHNKHTTGSWKGLAGKEGLKPTVTPKQYKAARQRHLKLVEQHNVAKSSVSAFGIDHGMVHQWAG